uniref:Electron transport complex subunit RsxB n=1 Tax=Candidatus Aschnera chinzeii TaxID=1485666 RepID=A0AAT9G4Q3_9ENTR|nr:MAG: electron transport complex subunit RsxB [Candidatus Aschnera chinzeii]
MFNISILIIYILGISGLCGIILTIIEYLLPINNNLLIQKINNMLPQTQCGKCGYTGCLPYAKAIINHQDNINKCIPGGEIVIIKIAHLLNIEYRHEMTNLNYDNNVAFIDENNCIGCTKCIKVCPVNAIVGSIHTIHTVISNICTGCELCITACPTDCISLHQITVLNHVDILK